MGTTAATSQTIGLAEGPAGQIGKDPVRKVSSSSPTTTTLTDHIGSFASSVQRYPAQISHAPGFNGTSRSATTPSAQDLTPPG
jgi:hypothetical protein